MVDAYCHGAHERLRVELPCEDLQEELEAKRGYRLNADDFFVTWPRIAFRTPWKGWERYPA